MLKSLVIINKCLINKQIYKLISQAKVLKFKQKNTGILTDEDISCLFLGMLNLIKNNAFKKAEQYYKKEVDYYQGLLNINITKVVKLERELKRLKNKTI